jgi:hypothetical protein
MSSIQEVARSIRVSSTNKIKHFFGFGQHRTGALSENLSELLSRANPTPLTAAGSS